MKPVSPAVAYASLLPLLMEVGRSSGYAIAPHGSMASDLDLIAVPWTEEAEAPEQLVMSILSRVYGTHLPPSHNKEDGTVERADKPTPKPHGRMAWRIHLENGLSLDLSVMPRIAATKGGA